MRKYTPKLLVFAALAVAVALPAHAGKKDPAAVLKSDASYRKKEEACRTLSRQGGPEAVPVLKQLLDDKKLSHMARYALERIPGSEADRALRDMLDKTGGDIRAGIIKSLEVRGDTKAIPHIAELLSADDPVVVCAAARALGRFGTPEAIDALPVEELLRGEPADESGLSAKEQHAFADALMSAAEALAARGKKERAADIYAGLLRHPDAPQPVRTSALRGLAVTQGADALPQVIDALHAKSEREFGAGIRAAREMEGGAEVSRKLAGELTDLSTLKKVRLLKALGERGHASAGPAIMDMAKKGKSPVRVAALKALTRIGYEDGLDLMKKLAWKADGKVAEAARDGLAYFPTPAGDRALREMLEHSNATARMAAVELIAKGGLPQPTATLLKVARTGSGRKLRLAALKAARGLADSGDLDGLLKLLRKAPSTDEMKAAESAVRSVLADAKRPSSASVKIKKAVYGDLPDGKSKNVTKKVKKMVQKGSLKVKASNRNFGDPASGIVKKLRISYTVNGTSMNKTVREHKTLTLTHGKIAPSLVDKLQSALEEADGPARMALVRLLRVSGSPKALKTVRSVASSADGKLRDTALRAICDWPGKNALPAIMDLVQDPPGATIKALAVRGAVRLLKNTAVEPGKMLDYYSTLMEEADTAGNKKAVLSGLAGMKHPQAFDLAVSQAADQSVRAEALQAAISIAGELGANAKVEKNPFDINNLDKWRGNTALWHAEDGMLVGKSEEKTTTTYLGAPCTAADFHLVARVKLTPNTGNSGIHFRSKIAKDGTTRGYQADMGKNVWGRIYHVGAGKLDWTGSAEKAVKPGKWNRYEILAVGPAIWLAINGKLGAAYLGPDRARSGRFGFQFHQGAPKTVKFRIEKLVRNPEVKLAGKGPKALIKALKPAKK